MADDALSTRVRWHAVVSYRTGGEPLAVEMFLREIEDLHDRIELGPHWDTVELIEIRRVNHTDSAELTLEQAEDVGNQPGELFEVVPLARQPSPLSRRHRPASRRR
jgi:hypothetical protein